MIFEKNGYLDDINKSGLYGSSEYTQDYNSIKLSMSQDPNYQLNYNPSSQTDSNYQNFYNLTQESENSLLKPSNFINPLNLPKIKYTQYFLKDLHYMHKSLIMLELQKFSKILLKKCILETINMRWKWPESIETREEIDNKFMDHILTPHDLKLIENEDLLNASASTISSNTQLPFYKPSKTTDKLKENSEIEDSNANYTQANKLHNLAPNLRFNIVQKFESTRKLVDNLLKKYQNVSEEDELKVRRAISMKLQLIFEQLSHLNDKNYYCKNKGDYPYNINLYGKAYLAGIPESVIERTRVRMEPLRERIRMVEGLNANKFMDGVEVINKKKYL
ncbi:hypothetical protein CONCODRAFT_73772 [Conidiobolus coronatus NRRL 28638]|uniref:Uncharacterized protein n=1 Tax=Conidiobolus coronatus (strain ATCC 28846 / CBS 209.66 / NRRL 28638) TaxID=796925 RepID=A0A137NU07_CONC2|nr:hypothetical protein CONCODRAFT_73772 [Conidiobolus coronatus NRRL 28638]|eukprot:KXN66285.1 hypothetical protein CONCODRAFT_73772 [Conidiobolus coronatus NRRL 28638]